MIRQLIEKIQKTDAPICVGLDPMLSYIPETIVKNALEEYGETMQAAAEAVWQYNKAIIDHTWDLIPAVKPQVAMYEQFGLEGMRVYEKTVSYCQEKGLVVIGDVKRGDIGSTSAAYAAGHLGSVQIGSRRLSGFHADFITVNPYLGTDGVKPFVDVCSQEDKGIFVLVKTSNPSSGEFQDRLIDGRPLYEWGADNDLSGDERGAAPADAPHLFPGAGLRSPGRHGGGSEALLQRRWTGRHRQLLQRHHRRLQAGKVQNVRSGAFRGGVPAGRAGYGRRHPPGAVIRE